jgi:hypothetical protein
MIQCLEVLSKEVFPEINDYNLSFKEMRSKVFDLIPFGCNQVIAKLEGIKESGKISRTSLFDLKTSLIAEALQECTEATKDNLKQSQGTDHARMSISIKDSYLLER